MDKRRLSRGILIDLKKALDPRERNPGLNEVASCLEPWERGCTGQRAI